MVNKKTSDILLCHKILDHYTKLLNYIENLSNEKYAFNKVIRFDKIKEINSIYLELPILNNLSLIVIKKGNIGYENFGYGGKENYLLCIYEGTKDILSISDIIDILRNKKILIIHELVHYDDYQNVRYNLKWYNKWYNKYENHKYYNNPIEINAYFITYLVLNFSTLLKCKKYGYDYFLHLFSMDIYLKEMFSHMNERNRYRLSCRIKKFYDCLIF